MMKNLTPAIIEGIEEELNKNFLFLKNRKRISEESFRIATYNSRALLEQLDLFSAKRTKELSRAYNMLQLESLNFEELLTGGLESLISYSDVPEDLNQDLNKLIFLTKIANDYYSGLARLRPNSLTNLDEIYLKLVQAMYSLNEQVAEGYVARYNFLFRSEERKTKKLVKIPNKFKVGLTIE